MGRRMKMNKLEVVAMQELNSSYAIIVDGELSYQRQAMLNMFSKGAQWQAEQSPWISVEERKPKHMQAVWVKSDINNHQQLRFCNGKFYTSFAHQTYDGSVTHWMPIPE